MDHEGRMRIIEQILADVKKKYGKHLISAGMYGSVARNEDKEFSDIDLLFITRRNIPSKVFSAEGVPVLLDFYTKADAISRVGKVSHIWPVEASSFLNQKILFGDKGIVKRFENEVKNIPEKDFKKASSECLVHMLEHLGKVRNAYDVKSLHGVYQSGMDFVWVSTLLIALLNRRYFVRSGPKVFEEISGFKTVPDNYIRIAKVIWSCDGMENVYFSCLKLFEMCVDFSKKNDVEMPEFN